MISNLVADSASPLKDADINLITVIPRRKYLKVDIEVAAPLDSVSQADIDRLRKFLTSKIDRPIDLQVEVIPMSILKSPRD